jgi:hypothetical protein
VLPDGAAVTWSIAEGRRGRRWREARIRDDGVTSSLLFETEPDGRFVHLELSTAAGLLTLHPEGDGTIHGNSIGAEGVRHIVGLPWTTQGIVLLDGSAITVAAAAHLLRGSIEPGRTVAAEALVIGLDLAVRRRSVEAERVSNLAWRFQGHDAVEVGEDGVPRFSEAREWPLEE